jgi:disease resistance protein RPS2
LDLDLKEVQHERERVAKLKAKLEDMKKYVLILDDMWEAFPLEKLGIPEPISSNRCKLVLTTRLLDVCLGMSCKNIKIELLSKEEVQNLFLDKLGCDVFNTPDLKVIVEEVLERCAQLPLAIVTIAASFKCLIHDFEWRDALEDLKTSVKGSNNIEAEVFKILEFSYERLKVGELQQCLLHCALYPEDFMIKKRELIEHLIDEGIIERRNSRKAEFDRGYSMLNKLENACLLEGGIDEDDEEKFVKMHDLVRDMVLRVASPQFKVEGHLGLEDFSDEGKWGEDLVRASLMYNNISRIPPNASPMCPKLSTLLLQGNRSLKDVPDSLFEHLHGLNVLDLSNTSIEYLPNSVSNLENLTTLRLGGCVFLKRVPSLAKLTKLRKLDLERTEIMEVLDGLEMLVNLRYLDLNVEKQKIMRPEILPKLSHLQYLVVHGLFTLVTMKGEEVASLKNLKTFGGLFSDMYEFSTYMRSLEKGRLASYKIQVGKPLYI